MILGRLMRRLTFIWQIMGWVFSFYLDSCILHVNHPCPLSFLFSCGPFDPAHSIYVGVSPFYSLWLRRDCTLAHLVFFFLTGTSGCFSLQKNANALLARFLNHSSIIEQGIQFISAWLIFLDCYAKYVRHSTSLPVQETN